MRLVSGSSSRARRRVLGLGAVVTVGLVVGGCTAEDPVEPEPSTSTAESPEVTEEPEPTPTETGPVKPERPAAMEQEDAEGAAAAAEYYLELYPYVMATGDTAEWEAMSHEACDGCRGLIDDASLRESDGDVFLGGELAATTGEMYARDELTGIFPLDVVVEQGTTQIMSTAGETYLSQQPSTYERRVEMGIRDGQWVVVTLAEVPAS